MMVFLPLDTWIRLLVWMLIGFDVYLFYGLKHSALSDHENLTYDRSNRIVSFCGIGLAVLLAIVALVHHNTVKEPDTVLFIVSIGICYFAFSHLFNEDE